MTGGYIAGTAESEWYQAHDIAHSNEEAYWRGVEVDLRHTCLWIGEDEFVPTSSCAGWMEMDWEPESIVEVI